MIGFPDMKFVLLHEAKNDDGIKAFFYDVWEVYLKVCPGAPLHHATAACQTPHAADCDEPVSFGSYTHSKPCLRQSGEGQCEKVSVEAVYCMSTDGARTNNACELPNMQRSVAVRHTEALLHHRGYIGRRQLTPGRLAVSLRVRARWFSSFHHCPLVYRLPHRRSQRTHRPATSRRS
jgi:hypothetical protein